MVRFRIRELLRERGWSVYRLRKELKLPATTVYRLVHRPKRVDLRLVGKLCRVLDCEPGDLFERVAEYAPKRRRKPTERGRG